MIVWIIYSSMVSLLLVTVTIVSWKKITHLHRDITTGLWRRLYIEQLLTKFGNKKTDVTIVIVDINGLRETNNRHGHKAGDDLLLLTADRLCIIGRQKRRWVGRLGGDEFIVIGTRVTCIALADEVEEALHAKHPLDDIWGLGVGGVSRTRHGETRTALECADMALLRAKRRFYESKQLGILQYNSQLDGTPKVDVRPVTRLRDSR